MAKANKDDWIRHRGGMCPVDDEQYVHVRLRDGYTQDFGVRAGNYMWTHDQEDGDIMTYRLHKPEQQPSPIQTAESLRARYTASEEEIRALEVTIAARQHDIAELEKERAELREKVRKLGFEFFGEPVEDMSDPTNWRVGDMVECVSSDDADIIDIGSIQRVLHIDEKGLKITDKTGSSRYTFEEVITYYKFHSRPTK